MKVSGRRPKLPLAGVLALFLSFSGSDAFGIAFAIRCNCLCVAPNGAQLVVSGIGASQVRPSQYGGVVSPSAITVSNFNIALQSAVDGVNNACQLFAGAHPLTNQCVNTDGDFVGQLNGLGCFVASALAP